MSAVSARSKVTLNCWERGSRIPSFGEEGRIDLRKNLRGDYQTQSIALTTPGIVYKDLIIVGGEMPETLPAPPGDIRAFDVHTGALRWSFHTIPHPGEYGYETWPPDAWKKSGAANNWAGMSLDAERGIVYVPTGSASFDFWRPSISMEAIGSVTISSRTRYWHLMPTPVSESGISRMYITTSGIEIFRQLQAF